MSVILLDEALVHYEVLGRGRPVIFLHGWVGSWRYWIPSMQVASTSFRAYALDLWGFGDTAHHPARYTLDQQMRLLDRFLDEMGIGKVALVGHGLGGVVALNYTVSHPERVDRVMAVSCPFAPNAVNDRLRSASPAELVGWLAARTPEAATALSDAPKADPQAIAMSMTALQRNDLFGKVRQARVPCLLVHGQNDPAIAPPSMGELARLSYHMHYISLDGSGHFPMIDDPSRFHRLLTDFLALDSGLSPRELQLKEEWKRRVR